MVAHRWRRKAITGATNRQGDGVTTVGVSVVMAAYNAEPYVARAIDSVRAQTLKDWELIVVDDASEDGTAAKVAAMAEADRRIQLIRCAANGGPARARNRALEVAQGQWIALLDADDWWEPDRLATLLDYGQRQHLDVVLDDIVLHGPRSGKQLGCWTDAVPSVRRYLGNVVTLADICGSSLSSFHPVVRRAALAETMVRYPEIRRSEDFGFLLELAWRGAAIGVYPGALYHYQIRQSGKGEAMYYGIFVTRRHWIAFMKSHGSDHWTDQEIRRAMASLRQQAWLGYTMYALRRALDAVPSARLRQAIRNAYEARHPFFKD